MLVATGTVQELNPLYVVTVVEGDDAYFSVINTEETYVEP